MNLIILVIYLCMLTLFYIAKWIKHVKKWNLFKLPENDILIDYANGLQPLYSIKWPDVDIVYVTINVQASHWVLGVVHLHRGLYTYMTH